MNLLAIRACSSRNAKNALVASGGPILGKTNADNCSQLHRRSSRASLQSRFNSMEQLTAIFLGEQLHMAVGRISNSKTEMKLANSTGEDSFEKARKAFFGTATTIPKPGAPPTEFLKPRNEAAAEEQSAALTWQSLPRLARNRELRVPTIRKSPSILSTGGTR